MTPFTVYDPISKLVLRSGKADRPEWHVRVDEAILLGVAGRRGWYVHPDGTVQLDPPEE